MRVENTNRCSSVANVKLYAPEVEADLSVPRASETAIGHANSGQLATFTRHELEILIT